MDNAGLDLGKSKATAGLTFVCLSHAKCLERLSKLGEKHMFQLRLREMCALKLAEEALGLQGGGA